MHQIGGGHILRSALWDHRDQRQVVANRAGERSLHARRVAQGGSELLNHVGLCSVGTLDGHDQWAVEARAEAFGKQVVRAANCLIGLGVAVVAEAEADGEQRKREHHQHACAEQEDRPWTALDEAAPAIPEALFDGLLGAMWNGLAQRLHNQAGKQHSNRKGRSAKEDACVRRNDGPEATSHQQTQRQHRCTRGDVDAVTRHRQQRR